MEEFEEKWNELFFPKMSLLNLGYQDDDTENVQLEARPNIRKKNLLMLNLKLSAQNYII